MKEKSSLNKKQKTWPILIGIPLGLAFIFIFAFLWLVKGAEPAFANPGTLYVDEQSGIDSGTCQDSLSPCHTIAYAISQALQGDDILVAQGTYTESLLINSGITLMGGYESEGWTRDIDNYETILDGNNSASVIAFQGASEGMTLDGFLVTGGMGSGITIEESSPTIKNTTVYSNQTSSDGGGIYISGGSPAIEDSEIRGNSATGCCGGIHIGNNASVIISNTQLMSNTAGYGGGLGVFSGSTVTVTQSTIYGNNSDFETGQGGGVHVGGGNPTLMIMNSFITNNHTRDHGAAISSDGGRVYLTNVLITGNQSSSNNANVFAIWNTDFTLMNSTIADNNPGGAQAVILWSGALTMTNSIMWNNALNFQNDSGCTDCINVTFSDIEGAWTGAGNINVNPLFVGTGNYQLQAISPCIDQGILSGAPLVDLIGNPRDASPDMGAYEWIGMRNYLPLLLWNGGS